MKVIEWVNWDDKRPDADRDNHQVRAAVCKAILRDNIRHGGFWHQYTNNGAPLLDDNTVVRYSLRGWGDIMAEALKLDDEDGLAYCKYAWTN